MPKLDDDQYEMGREGLRVGMSAQVVGQRLLAATTPEEERRALSLAAGFVDAALKRSRDCRCSCDK